MILKALTPKKSLNKAYLKVENLPGGGGGV